MRCCRSYRYLLQPTGPQRTRFETLLRNQCELYNATLEDNLTTASAEAESTALRSGYTFVRIEGYVTKR